MFRPRHHHRHHHHGPRHFHMPPPPHMHHHHHHRPRGCCGCFTLVLPVLALLCGLFVFLFASIF